MVRVSSCPQWVSYIDLFFRGDVEWVPEYLQDDTQDSLREQMRTDPSSADEYGFIYAFEIDGEFAMRNFLLWR